MSPEAGVHPLVPVPADKRAFGLRDAFALWFSLGIGLLVLQAGALLVPGLSLAAALCAIVVGTLVGVFLLAAAGMVGTDTGVSAMAGLRPTLGIRGAAVPAILNVVQLVGWGTFELVAMRDAADALARSHLGWSEPWLWTVLFGAAAGGLAWLGPLSVVRGFLRRYGLWLVLAGAAWLTVSMVAHADLAALFAKPGTGELGFGAGVDLVVAMPLSWLPLISDYSRYGRDGGQTFRGTTLGYAIGNTWFYALGAAYALTPGAGDLSSIDALAAAGGGFALLLILVDETENAFADIYSAAVSSASVVEVPVGLVSVGVGVLCTVLALGVPIGQYQDFLFLIGSVFAPLFGVLLTDHFVLRRRRIDAGALTLRGGAYWFLGGINVTAFAAWVVGFAAYKLLNATLPALGATLPSVVVAALAYLAGSAMLVRTRGVRSAG